MVSITFAPGAHCALSGASGGFASGSFSSGTNITNASWLPSGDQLMAFGLCLTLLITAAWPVSIQRTCNCAPRSSSRET